MKQLIKCENCNKEVIPTSNRQRFCPACRVSHDKAYQKNYHVNYGKTEHGRSIIKLYMWKRQRKIHAETVTETFTMKQWYKKLDATYGVCPRCGKFVGKEDLTIDHIYPVSKAKKGRVYTIKDIQPLCRACNSSKYNKIGA